MLALYMSIANGVSWEQVVIPLHAATPTRFQDLSMLKDCIRIMIEP